MNRRKSKTTLLWLCVALATVCMMTSSVFAHHGWSSYDPSKTLNLTGVIRESSYSNPHGLIRLQADGENGKVWLAVLAPPSRMRSRGLLPEMLQEGITATVVGYPRREKADEMRAERITIDGKTVELR